MSRSNPTDNLPHPCTRWIEWDGGNGEYRYYDKESKVNVSLGDAITFLLLDQLATVKGWHDPSDSGIYSNEVRDIQQDVLVVKSFKGGPLAEGTYKSIKDTVVANGGHFVANLYVAVKIGTELAIASIQFKGAALAAWMEFRNKHRADLYKKAIRSKGYTEAKKGKITYRFPAAFSLTDVSEETEQTALALDTELQQFLEGYFKRTRVEQVAQVAKTIADKQGEQGTGDIGGDRQQPQQRNGRAPPADDFDDDIPF